MKVLLKSTHFRVGAILLITFLVYIPSMRAGFIWDDDMFLTHNPLIKAVDGLYRFWFTTEPPDYFPLVSSSLWFEWRLWGMNATGYHAVNVVLHAVSSVLIWLVLERLKIPGAWLAGLVFAVHPVNVESVAWITERKNTQSMAFYVATILLYLKFENDGRRRWYLLSSCLFLMGLLSKTSVVMLPLVLLGCAWWQRGGIVRKDIVRTIPFFALSGILGLVTIWFQYDVGGDVVRTDGFLSRLVGAGWAVWFYLYKAIIPCKLSFVYPRWEIDASSFVSYLPVIALLGCFLAFWLYRKRWGRAFLFGLGYYVVTLFPVVGFFNIYFMKYSLVADHWQYTSIIAIIALATGVGHNLRSRCRVGRQKLLSVATVSLVCLLCVLTWRQEYIYRDVETLWLDTISKNPEAWMAHNNLGIVLDERGRLEEAIVHFSEALRIKPDYSDAHVNMGLSLVEQGKLREAMHYYSEALRIKPDHPIAPIALNSMGAAMAKQGKLKEAISHYSEALRIKPDYWEAHYNTGVALDKLGRLEEAVGYYSEALRIKPNDAFIHNNLGVTLSDLGRLEEAIGHFSEALRIKPDYAEARYNRQLCLRRQSDF